MARLVSRAELSRMAGVSDAAITKACRGKLAAACEDKRVDLDHPSVRSYLTSKGVKPPPLAGARRKDTVSPPAPIPTRPTKADTQAEASSPGSEDAPKGIEDIELYDHLTLKEIAERFGSMTAHADWLDMRKTQVAIRSQELKNGELEGKLIPREAVKTHVFGAIERANKQLLQDAARTITRRVLGMAKANGTAEEIETTVREIIGSHLAPVKETAARALRSR
jgi:hypothetical protein